MKSALGGQAQGREIEQADSSFQLCGPWGGSSMMLVLTAKTRIWPDLMHFFGMFIYKNQLLNVARPANGFPESLLQKYKVHKRRKVIEKYLYKKQVI